LRYSTTLASPCMALAPDVHANDGPRMWTMTLNDTRGVVLAPTSHSQWGAIGYRLPQWEQPQPVGQTAVSASSMMRLMVRAQRPHWGLQPRQP
jgi:hypothetical protein